MSIRQVLLRRAAAAAANAAILLLATYKLIIDYHSLGPKSKICYGSLMQK